MAVPTHQASSQAQESTGLTLASYILLLIPLPVFPLIGLIIALVNTDHKPEWIATHYRWQWRTVAKGFLFAVVGALTAFIGIGIVILVFTFIWSIVRHVKGISALNARLPIENYRSWWWSTSLPVPAATVGGEPPRIERL